MSDFLLWVCGITVIYWILAFFCFNFVREPKKLEQFAKKQEYYLYFFEFICLFFSLFTLLLTFGFLMNSTSSWAFLKESWILAVPLLHFLNDSLLFMFISAKFQGNTKPNTEKIQKKSFFSRLFTDPLQTFHHFFLILIYLFGFFSKNQRFFVFFVLLDEISVPLLLLRKQLQRLEMDKSQRFRAIELTFIIIYVISRGILLPWLSFSSTTREKVAVLLVCAMNWLNYFWILQTLCLFMKKLREIGREMPQFLTVFLEKYRNNAGIKWKTHLFLLFPLILYPLIA